ncbi:cobalamin biosynthesis protein [uncultured Phascolarctobacterium sp.]|uniref:cobalt-precorrin 5A hydrolase n=1 Tax=uncultured Phascolarctobacterium sp. TaxID=512296 RepID=UPI0027D9605B|nr:cobalamin biosynthesis protein [uncultured Phascolarctobacterium sp.]
MQAVVYSFTRRGAKLSVHICEALQRLNFAVRCLTMAKFADEADALEAMTDHNKACAEAFKECQLIVFVGAVGIAVRTIAPYIKNKTVDPAVLSVDEGGGFVVPLLAGHIGGANGFARALAAAIKAVPIVTTATDVNSLFAVDEWAVRNKMVIADMQAAKTFAAALVDGQQVGLIADYPIISALPKNIALKDDGDVGMAVTKDRRKQPFAVTVQLWPQNLYLGIGCRRGTELKAIEALVLPQLDALGLDLRTVAGIASVDLKKDEAGLLAFAAKYGWQVKFYTANQLLEVSGEFSSSEFVKSVVGVSNVCERSAVLAASGGRLVLPKCSLNGVTLAVAEADIVLDFDNLT